MTFVRTTIIGCGSMARHHVRTMLSKFPDTRISVLCEPSEKSLEAMHEVFESFSLSPPPNVPDLAELLARHAGELDAALIATPHALHHDQARACLEAGLDVFLEKPMVMNEAEARSLVNTCEKTGRSLVVAFQGSLSPHVRKAAAMVASGELGPILNINAQVWQNWKENTAGTWRQEPDLSGGGFLFDTGAHLLNTVADIAGEDFVEVSAWMDNQGSPVDILAAVMGRLKSGGLVTLSACGDGIPACDSDVRIYTPKGVLRTGIWGGFLEMLIDSKDGFEPVDVPASLGGWEKFLMVREGRIENPCPPVIGLRMIRLWNAIQASALKGGQKVSVEGNHAG